MFFCVWPWSYDSILFVAGYESVSIESDSATLICCGVCAVSVCLCRGVCVCVRMYECMYVSAHVCMC